MFFQEEKISQEQIEVFDKRQRFSHDEIKVLPRGRGVSLSIKKIWNKILTEKYRGFTECKNLVM